MAPPVEVVLRFASGEPDCRISVTENLSVSAISEKVRRSVGWPDSAHLRFIHQGRPLGTEDVIVADPGRGATIIHCVKTDSVPAAGDRTHDTKDYKDWLDSVDTGAALCWIIAALLVVCWIVYLFSEIQAPNSAFSFLLGMSAAAVAGLLWPVLNPILDVFYHWWTQYMDCSPCLPGEEGAQPGVRRRQGNTPPRPPAPGPAGYRLRQFRQAESPLYSSS